MMTVVDPARRWKRQESDAFGDLREVYGPKPGGGGDYATYYSYNALGALLTVSMTRPGANNSSVTQTRTYTYNTDGTLASEQFPETGLTRYVYSNGKMVKKIRSDNRSTKWEYDASTQRLLSVRRLGVPTLGDASVYDGAEDVSGDTKDISEWQSGGQQWPEGVVLQRLQQRSAEDPVSGADYSGQFGARYVDGVVDHADDGGPLCLCGLGEGGERWSVYAETELSTSEEALDQYGNVTSIRKREPGTNRQRTTPMR